MAKGKYQKFYESKYGNKNAALDTNTKKINNYSARLAAAGIDPDKATDKRNFIEKALNLKQDQNFIFDISEILNRPQQALFGGIKSLQEGDTFLEGAKEGITGNRETRFKEILKEFDPETFKDTEGKLDLVDILGFAGDVALDPMNLPIVPVNGGAKLASATDLIGMGAKAGLKGGASLADKGIEKVLANLDETKGVVDAADNVVKLGYANKAADRAADLQKYVANADELVGKGANLPMGRLESYKNIKDSVANMFKVPDAAKEAILKGREADFVTENYRKKVALEINKDREVVQDVATKLNMSPDDLSKDLMLFAETRGPSQIKASQLLQNARDGKALYNEETVDFLQDLLKDISDDPAELERMGLTIGEKNGRIVLGNGWKPKNMTKEFDPSKFKIRQGKELKDRMISLGEHYSDDIQKRIDNLNDLYKNNSEFKRAADTVVGDIWNGGKNEGLVNRLNKIIDEGSFSTDLVGKYNEGNINYVPHIQNFDWKDIKDYSSIPEGVTKGSVGLLSERRNTGPAAMINELWDEQISKNYLKQTDKGKAFIDSHRKLFEDDMLKAIENRYFEQLPNTLKQNKIVNDVLIGQTFGNFDDIKKLQSDIHKYSINGDVENLKKATEAYNEMTKNSTIKFLTDYDNKVPQGYKQLSKKEAEQLIGKFNTIEKQLGGSEELGKVLKAVKNQGDKIAIDENVLRMMQVSVEPKNINAFSRMYDKWLNTFKKWKTASPQFLMNNLVGNSSNLYLSGIDITEQAKYGSTVADIISNGEKYSNMLLNGDTLTESQKHIADLWNTANEIGIMGGKGNLTALNLQDMPESVLKYFKDGTKPQGAEWIKDAVPYFNNMANQKMDAAARLTVMLKSIDDPKYIKNLGITSTGNTAIRDAVAKVMFDPDMLTPFERNYMKKIVPFYTYAKNNLVYHLDNMGQNLGRYQRLMKSVKGLQDMATDGNRDNMAEYLKNSMYIPIPGLGKNGEYVMLRANLPFGQVVELADDPLQELVNMTTPLIKTPVELVTNRSAFTGRDIEKFPGQKSTNIPFLTKKQETMLSGLSGYDVPLKTLNRIYQGTDLENDPFGGIRNAFTMTNSVDADKLNRSYEKIEDLQNAVKQYQQKGYQISTINELKKANKNKKLANISAILAKYNIQ